MSLFITTDCFQCAQRRITGTTDKPYSAPTADYSAAGASDLSGTPVARRVVRPTQAPGRSTVKRTIFGLAPGGVYPAGPVGWDRPGPGLNGT